MQNGSKKYRVLVAGHDQKFWHPLQADLEKTGQFEFREDYWPGHNSHDERQTLELMKWADIILAEWSLGNAVFCAEHKRPDQRLVIRFHLQERDTEYPSKIDYDNVDMVVFVGEHIRQECIRKFAIPPLKTMVIGNFVDQKKYDKNKRGGAEFNLGLIGSAPSRKRLDLAFETLEILSEIDDRYSLHVKGKQPQNIEWLWARTKEREFYSDVYEKINSSPLRHRVVFDPQGNDVQSWLEKIGFILSPSDFESFHMAVAEGMSSGSAPVIWSWDGAKEIYPTVPVVENAAEAAAYIDRLRRSSMHSKLSQQGKALIHGRYDVDVVVNKWTELFLPKTKSIAHKATSVRNVVVFWCIDSWDMFHRREMIEAFAANAKETCDFLIIEHGNHFKTLLERGICPQEELEQFAALSPIQLTDNSYRMRLLTGGFPEGVKVADVLRKGGSIADISEAAVKAIFGNNSNVLHWIYKPDQVKNLPATAEYIYEVYDEYTRDFSSGALIPAMIQLEPQTLANARHVFFTSEPLLDRKQKHCRSYSLVSNGVNFDAFDKWRVNEPTGNNLRKSVGYLGNLSDFFDWQLMAEVCAQLPEIDFYFHGQIERARLTHIQTAVSRLENLPNTIFTGRVNREFGAAAVNRYDALVIPFVVNDAMHAVNPLKLWEYFATGKPVISSPMDAVSIESPVLRNAASSEEWVNAINDSINSSDVQASEKRRELALELDWRTLTKKHYEILQDWCSQDMVAEAKRKMSAY
ncbi:glycosyltransferase [Phyllobacterium sp. YR531]|uniref:glycosyltransferase family 4 protein n=1 Tax=Phyllobacterium sp. YR531 TaxID=1144343 RepID=UPI00026FAA16|nr:glycosyltransferase [Phyllobacterium sp. YR531]EJN02274.1 glycosyltransferase [Phyllobacterium sp. YR531]